MNASDCQGRSAYFILALPLFFFFYQFVLRAWPSLLVPELMAQFSVNAKQFGVINAFYYYGYAGMQIPTAILLEKYATRWVIAGYVTFCALGTIIFTYADGFEIACVGRALVGIGSAVGFLGSAKVIAQCFSKERYGRVLGLSCSLAYMGALWGGGPTSELIQWYGAHNVSLALAGVALALSIAIIFVLRFLPSKQEKSEVFSLKDLRIVVTSPFLWMIAVSGLLMIGTMEGLSDVWGVSYIQIVYGLSRTYAASLVPLLYVGMILGITLMPVVSRFIGDCTTIILCGIGIVLFFAIFMSLHSIFSSALSINYISTILASLCCALGLLSGYQANVFSLGATCMPLRLISITTAFLNCVMMVGGSFFHSLIGFVLEQKWDGLIQDSGPVYSASAYQWAIAVIPACALIGVVIAFIARQTEKIA